MAGDVFEQIRARAFEKADKIKADFDARIDALIAMNKRAYRIEMGLCLFALALSMTAALFAVWIATGAASQSGP